MRLNTANILTVAQKEFADNLSSSRFRVLLAIIIVILLSYSVTAAKSGFFAFEDAIFVTAFTMGLYLPLLGIALGFDAIIKELVSNSMNILLAHPVFRDSIILGKMAGGFGTLIFVILLSILSSVGIMLVLSGMPVSLVQINQVIVFAVISLIYLSLFFALGVLFSVTCNNPSKSFIFSMMFWVVFVIMFGPISSFIASVATGETVYSENGERTMELYNQLQYLSPLNHYSQVIMGSGMSISGTDQKVSAGIFDPEHTLGQWFKDYWTNVVELTIIPVLLIVASVLAFMKKDVVR